MNFPVTDVWQNLDTLKESVEPLQGLRDIWEDVTLFVPSTLPAVRIALTTSQDVAPSSDRQHNVVPAGEFRFFEDFNFRTAWIKLDAGAVVSNLEIKGNPNG